MQFSLTAGPRLPGERNVFESPRFFAAVGVTETCEQLAEFTADTPQAAHDAAAEFIGTLPDHEQGIYYLDLGQSGNPDFDPANF